MDVTGNKKENESLLPGNLSLTDGTSRWVYGFYPSFALIDNEKVAYEKIEKKGKKTIIKTSKGVYTITPVKDRYKVEHGKKTEICSTTQSPATIYPQEDFSVPIIRSDTAYLNGYIDGFSPLAGFDAGIIYLNNLFTREDRPIVVSIDSTGYFEVKLPLLHPVSTSILFNDIYSIPLSPQTTLIIK